MAKVTHTMTLKRLLRNGLTYTRLQEFFEAATSYLDFFDKLKDIGIDRKASKAMARNLSAMGLKCRGGSIKEGSGENYSVSDCENVECDHDLLFEDMFYEMFGDAFFHPPAYFEYEFGSFTYEEMRSVDQEIAALLQKLCYSTSDAGASVHVDSTSNADAFDACNETVDAVVPDLTMPDKQQCHTFSNDEINNLFLEHIAKMEKLKHEQIQEREHLRYKDFVCPESTENWEDEREEDYREFLMPDDRGVLAKVVPIGMTMDNLNGESLSAKVPLFNYFDSFDIRTRPEGGIVKPFKTAKKNRGRLKKKKENRVETFLDDTSDGSLMKAENGKLFRFI